MDSPIVLLIFFAARIEHPSLIYSPTSSPAYLRQNTTFSTVVAHGPDTSSKDTSCRGQRHTITSSTNYQPSHLKTAGSRRQYIDSVRGLAGNNGALADWRCAGALCEIDRAVVWGFDAIPMMSVLGKMALVGSLFGCMAGG